MRTDFDKLVNGTHTADNRPVADCYVTGHLGIITGDTVIPHQAIMGKVTIGHDQAVFADYRFFPVLGTPVNGNELPDSGPVANIDIGIFSLEFQILRYSGNNRPGENAAVFANPGAFHYGYIGADPGSFPDLHILVNHRKGVNFYIGGQFRVGMNISVGMNHFNNITARADGQS